MAIYKKHFMIYVDLYSHWEYNGVTVDATKELLKQMHNMLKGLGVDKRLLFDGSSDKNYKQASWTKWIKKTGEK